MSSLKTDIRADGESIIVAQSQDVSKVLEYTKKMHNEGNFGSSDMRYAMSIPNIVIEEYMHKWGVTLHDINTDDAHMSRLLADPELSNLRVWKGRA